MDGLLVSIRAEGKIVKHTIYLALAINLDGKKEFQRVSNAQVSSDLRIGSSLAQSPS